jgi:hypothetical protein
MGYSVRVLPEHRLGLVHLDGRVDMDAIIEAFRRVVLDPAWEPGFSTAWDAGRVRVLVFLPEDLPRLAEATGALSARHGAGRTAMLARNKLDEITADVLRMRWGGNPGRELRAFLTTAEAASWLGVPPDVLEPPERAEG